MAGRSGYLEKWEGHGGTEHVADEVAAFERLWEDEARSVEVPDFPEAARRKLLEFRPSDEAMTAILAGDRQGATFQLRVPRDSPGGRFDRSGVDRTRRARPGG